MPSCYPVDLSVPITGSSHGAAAATAAVAAASAAACSLLYCVSYADFSAARSA
ncbi:hypothetical protein N9L76_09630 [bacterium]|nr:hypothetical protein [bacterium]